MQRCRYRTSQMWKTVILVCQASVLAATLVSPHGVNSALAGQAPGPAAARQDSPMSTRLQSLLDSLVAAYPGVRSALVLVDGPTLRWKGATGVAFADSQVAALPDDQFNIDSIAKMMTATIAMKLVEQGKLKLAIASPSIFQTRS